MCEATFLRSYALVLARLPDEFTTREIEEYAGGVYITLYNYTRLYRRVGFIERVGRGKWRLTERGKKARDTLKEFLRLLPSKEQILHTPQEELGSLKQ